MNQKVGRAVLCAPTAATTRSCWETDGAHGVRSDAPYQPVHGTDVRPILEVELMRCPTRTLARVDDDESRVDETI